MINSTIPNPGTFLGNFTMTLKSTLFPAQETVLSEVLRDVWSVVDKLIRCAYHATRGTDKIVLNKYNLSSIFFIELNILVAN